MAIKAIPFEGWHLDWIDVQDAQKAELAKVTAEQRNALARQKSWTATDGERLLMCGGLIPIVSECRALAWTFMGKVGRKEFLELHHKVRKYIRDAKYPRLEMEVKDDFAEGHRWARALGFHQEPMGGGHTLYVRIR